MTAKVKPNPLRKVWIRTRSESNIACESRQDLLLSGIGSASAGDEDDGGHREDEERDREGTDTSRAHLLDGCARSRCKALSCRVSSVSRASRRTFSQRPSESIQVCPPPD